VGTAAAPGCVPVLGVHSIRLCTLPGGGVLHLARDGALVVVHRGGDANLLRLQCFGGPADTAWRAVAAEYPGLEPGSAFPRFRLVLEPSAMGALGWALLDLARLDILVRECDRAVAERHLRAAECDPDRFVRRLRAADERARLRLQIELAGGGPPGPWEAGR